MNTFTKTEVFLSVFVQKRSSVNGALEFNCFLYFRLCARCACVVIINNTWMFLLQANITNITAKRVPQGCSVNWAFCISFKDLEVQFLASVSKVSLTRTRTDFVIQ